MRIFDFFVAGASGLPSTRTPALAPAMERNSEVSASLGAGRPQPRRMGVS